MAKLSILEQFYSPAKAREELHLPSTPIEHAIETAIRWFDQEEYLNRRIDLRSLPASMSPAESEAKSSMGFFKEKVVVVTGSSRGIGKATALAFGRQGAHVVLNGRNEERLKQSVIDLEAEGISVIGVAGDVSKTAEANHIVQESLKAFGSVDILVCNAGMSMRSPFESLSEDVVQKVVGSNLFGTINMAQAALPYIRESKGSLVFISSLAGIRGLPWVSVYSASKMALTGLAESLKLELEGTGVHVGLVYVGITQNEPNKRVLNGDGELIALEWEGIKQGQSREEVAQAVLKLVRNRQFKSVLSVLGKFEAYANRFTPGFVEMMLRRSSKTLEKSFR